MKPSASAPICRLEASGRRRRLARPKRQVALRQPLQERVHRPRRERRRDEQAADAADHDCARFRVLRLPRDQERDDGRA